MCGGHIWGLPLLTQLFAFFLLTDQESEAQHLEQHRVASAVLLCMFATAVQSCIAEQGQKRAMQRETEWVRGNIEREKRAILELQKVSES